MGRADVTSTHIGGPIGLAGLVLMTGAAASLAMVSALGGEDSRRTSQLAPQTGEQEASSAEAAQAVDDTITARPIPSDREIIMTGPRDHDPVVLQPADAGARGSPAGQAVPITADGRPVELQAEVQSQPPNLPQVNTKADFIVRFKGVPEVDECLETYRKDPEEARKIFADWASDKPELSGFKLSGVTYSGEAILSYESGRDTVSPAAQVRALSHRIQQVEGVRYADPDFTAQPGKGDER